MVRDRDTFNVYRGNSESEDDSDASEDDGIEAVRECSDEDASSRQADDSDCDAASESSATPAPKKKGKGKALLPSSVPNPFSQHSAAPKTRGHKSKDDGNQSSISSFLT